MALPRQVRQKIEEVEALEKQLNGNNDAEPPEEPTVEPEEPPKEPPAEPEKPKTAKVEDVKGDGEPSKPADDADVWKQKYRTLQGMYDKEVPTLHSQVKELKAQLDTLKADKAQAVEQAKAARKQLVTDEDVQTFGEDLIEVQRKVAREVSAEFEDRLEAMQAENAKLREALEGTTGEVRQSSFKAELLRLVPDFEQVDSDPDWVKWLDSVDPILRAPRRTVAQQAYASGDAQAVAHYVNLFRQQQAPAVVEPPATTKPTKQQELERQIQPTRTAPSATPTSQKGKTYTNSEIQQMFKRITQLGNMGKFDEANKLEAEIDAAYVQGRVQG